MSLLSPDWTLGPCVPAGVTKQEQGGRLEEEVLEIFDQFRNRVLRYVLALGLPIQDGEEVVQEIFLSLFLHLRRGRPRHNLRGWLFRVAHNLASKQGSANHRLREVMESDDGPANQQWETGLNPEERMMQWQRQQRLLAVVRALPEQDQLCLRLRGEGLRYREIAETLGISVGSVSNSLTRSLARLARVDGR